MNSHKMHNRPEQFFIISISDYRYENMIIELGFGSAGVAILSSDDGIEKTQIEFQHKFKDEVIHKFNYYAFTKALKLAFEELNKISQPADIIPFEDQQ